jgi:hypothetical protein
MSHSRIGNAMAIAAALCSFALASACTATAQPPMPAGGVTLAAQFPGDVTVNRMPPGAQRTTETIQLVLTNSSASAITLQRPNDCETRLWTVTDSMHQTIDDQAICPMIFLPVSLTIGPHATFAATKLVMLDGSKYQDGVRYTLHYTFWGVAAEVGFTAHVVN